MPPRTAAGFELLERRRLLSAVFPNDHEQYLVELLNRARANPLAEAARFGIDLNEGVPFDQTISATAKQPLAINPYITDAARMHSQWMIDQDVFSHSGAGGSTPGGRMSAAGYTFSGSSKWGENIAWSGTTGTLQVTPVTGQLHENLFVDADIVGRGHRVNMLDADFREVGAGVVTGAFTSGLNTYNAVMATQDFGLSGGDVFLTGVAFTDAVVDDDFYTPGEGLGGVTIVARRLSDDATFTTNTWTSGGYSLALPPGTYAVSGNGIGLGGIVDLANVVIGAVNVKRDFAPDGALPNFAIMAGGALTVTGTAEADIISVDVTDGQLVAMLNDIAQSFVATGVTSISVFAGAGNDELTVGSGVIGIYADGGEGDDCLVGGDGRDTLTGGAGKDRIYGRLGDDRLNGSGGHDRLFGEEGKDRLYGGPHNDTLDGGAHTDRLWGGGGNDTLFGQGGDDYFYVLDGLPDYLAGGSGTDTANQDPDLDLLASIEQLV